MMAGIEAGILHPQGGRGLGWVPGWLQGPSGGEGGGEGAGRDPGACISQREHLGKGRSRCRRRDPQAAPTHVCLQIGLL